MAKAAQDIRSLARAHTETAVRTLAGIMREKKAPSAARVAAATALMDRGWGKPTQAVKHSGSVGSYDLTKVTDADLERLENILGPLAVADGDTSGEGETAGPA